MRLDDCMESNGAVEISVGQFYAWFSNNYSDMRIHAVYNEAGDLIEVRFSGEYYFSDEVVVTFAVAEVETANDASIQDEKTATEEKKPVATFAQVTEALKQGYISPLNNDVKKDSNVVAFPAADKVDQDKNIKSVVITMSEGRIMDSQSDISLTIYEYEKIAATQAMASNGKQYH